ncbi:MAG: hypothetical protein QM690_21665 [Sphingobium sp.]
MQKHPLIEQALSNGARLDRGEYEVASINSPYGKEVMVRGEMKRHKAVRRVPQYQALYRQGIIDRAMFAALEWYDGRLGLAESGMYKCGLDTSGTGGGAPGRCIPVGEAAMQARSDVEWARSFIDPRRLPAFDAVMMEGETFREAARRMHAHRYVRISVRHARRVMREEFVQAARDMLNGVASRIMSKRTGRILVSAETP